MYNAIFDMLLVAGSFSTAYTISYVATLKKPFLRLREYSFALFLSLLLFSFSFSFAARLFVNALLNFDFSRVAEITMIFFSIIMLQKSILAAKKEKIETEKKIQRKTKKRYEPRRYFYT